MVLNDMAEVDKILSTAQLSTVLHLLLSESDNDDHVRCIWEIKHSCCTFRCAESYPALSAVL